MLQRYLNNLVRHPSISESTILQSFLQDEFFRPSALLPISYSNEFIESASSFIVNSPIFDGGVELQTHSIQKSSAYISKVSSNLSSLSGFIKKFGITDSKIRESSICLSDNLEIFGLQVSDGSFSFYAGKLCAETPSDLITSSPINSMLVRIPMYSTIELNCSISELSRSAESFRGIEPLLREYIDGLSINETFLNELCTYSSDFQAFIRKIVLRSDSAKKQNANFISSFLSKASKTSCSEMNAVELSIEAAEKIILEEMESLFVIISEDCVALVESYGENLFKLYEGQTPIWINS